MVSERSMALGVMCEYNNILLLWSNGMHSYNFFRIKKRKEKKIAQHTCNVVVSRELGFLAGSKAARLFSVCIMCPREIKSVFSLCE
jgi:hypothetical protein